MSKKKVLYPETENGIYMYEYVQINGICQYVQIRGKDKRNPLLLMLHGGPGGSMAGLCHALQQKWEEEFTVVNWDQRNAGKTYFANESQAWDIAKTGSMEDYMQDMQELIAYLHTVYEFEKLVVLGFSWGSVIGAEYSRRYPEQVAAYMGVGQVIHFLEGFEKICKDTMKAAKEKGKDKDVAKMQSIMDKMPTQGVMTDEFREILPPFSMLASKYLVKNSKPFPFMALLTSPFLNAREKMLVCKQDMRLFDGTYHALFHYDFRSKMRFEVPVWFVNGEEDVSCPNGLLAACYDEIEAPFKKNTVLKKTGHMCFLDQPELFYELLVEMKKELLFH